MDENTNLDENELEIARIDDSINLIEKDVDNSRRIVRLLENEDFKIVVMENLLDKEKRASVERLVNDSRLTVEQELKMLQELRSLREMENYIYATAKNLKNREAKLRAEKQFRADTLKNQNQEEEI